MQLGDASGEETCIHGEGVEGVVLWKLGFGGVVVWQISSLMPCTVASSSPAWPRYSERAEGFSGLVLSLDHSTFQFF